MTFETVRKIGLALPGVEESTSYGTPSLRTRKRLIARLKEDGTTLVLRVDDDDLREGLLSGEPEVFFVTDHYRGYPLVLVRLPRMTAARLRPLLEEAVRRATPAKGSR